MGKLFFHFVISTVRIFFREIRVVGLDRLPPGPIVVAGNHPNGLVDPVVVRIALGRDVGFLAKSTLFENPVGKSTAEAFNAVPVYRHKDGSDTSKNMEMFEGCYRKLNDGIAIALFPEGTSHSDPRMRKLKTGAARIALGAEAANPDLGLFVVPIGLFYEAKQTFRSRVSVAIGEPISVADYMGLYAQDDHQAARALTNDVADRMSEVVLEADSGEVWQMFVQVAKWMDPESEHDVGRTQEYANQLAAGYQELNRRDPEAADEIAQRVLLLSRLVEDLGVTNPLDLEDLEVSISAMIGFIAPMIFFAPFAAIGVAAGWLPYTAFGPVARKFVGEELDLVSTLKVIQGMVFMPLVWGAEAFAIGYFWGWYYGVIAAVFLPLCGYVAVRYQERLTVRKAALQARWLRLTRADMAAQIEESRRQLSTDIQATLKMIGDES